LSALGVSSVLAVFAASVAGSVHCVGMCGGLMLSATGSRLKLQMAYHFARFMGYLSVGAIAGAAGENLFSSWEWQPLQVFFATLVLTLLILSAVNLIFNLKILSRISQFGIGWGYRVGKWEHSIARPITIGFFTVFLPCGWLYGFVLLAVSTHQMMTGALILSVFWLGTLPAMMGSRILLQGLFAKLGVKGSRVVSLLMILAAVVSVWAHLVPTTEVSDLVNCNN
jgi:sulfite exporter TauE/SafE